MSHTMREKWSDEALWEQFDEIRHVMLAHGLSPLMAWHEIAVKLREELVRQEEVNSSTIKSLTYAVEVRQAEIDSLRNRLKLCKEVQRDLENQVREAKKELAVERNELEDLPY